MPVSSKSTEGPSEDVTNASNINADEIVADALYSLLDAVDSESIADEFRIGVHSDKHDFTNHVKVAVREGLDPSSSLAELEDKTAVDDSLGPPVIALASDGPLVQQLEWATTC